MIILNLIKKTDIIACNNGKINLTTHKFEPLNCKKYIKVTSNLDYNEKENKDLINKYHKIHVHIYVDYAGEVETWIAYSMKGDTFFNTNFLFNLGESAANGESTISHMYQKVLLISWDEISPETFNSKNKNNHKSLNKYQTAKHIFCNEMDIYYKTVIYSY